MRGEPRSGQTTGAGANVLYLSDTAGRKRRGDLSPGGKSAQRRAAPGAGLWARRSGVDLLARKSLGLVAACR